MKWEKIGHEYDDVYREIEKKSKYYLFGAGDYGKQFLKIFENEIDIIGYIDNSVEKQNKSIYGYPCFCLEEIKLKKDEGIVLTMSQIARVHPIEQLIAAGYNRNVDFFVIEEFISIYQVYKHNRVYFSSISFLPSTACNLNCKLCLNFNPYSDKVYVRQLEELKKDVDLFFGCVDHVMLFHISGGEPFLYKNTIDLIEYIDSKYGDRIDTLRTVTNGTQVPREDILERLSKCNIEITVDDYRKSVPQYNDKFDVLIAKLEYYNIKYFINKADSWIDLAPERTDYSGKDEKWIIQHRDSCNQSWQELRDGKLYSCNYASYATVAGIAGKQDEEEVFDLTQFDAEKRKELVEFRLGFTSKGYTNFCKKCRGFTPENDVEMIPAEQLCVGDRQ